MTQASCDQQWHTWFIAITSQWDNEMHFKESKKDLVFATSMVHIALTINLEEDPVGNTKTEAHLTPFDVWNSAVLHVFPLLCRIPSWKTVVRRQCQGTITKDVRKGTRSTCLAHQIPSLPRSLVDKDALRVWQRLKVQRIPRESRNSWDPDKAWKT